MIEAKDGTLKLEGNAITIMAEFCGIVHGIKKTIIESDGASPEMRSVMTETIVKMTQDIMNGSLADEVEEYVKEEKDDRKAQEQFEANKILDEVFKSFGL